VSANTHSTSHPDHRDVLLAANEDAATFYRRRLLGPEAEGPRSYLTERGFGALLDDTPWTVGYAPGSWTALRDHLAEAGYSDDTLIAAGLCSVSRRGSAIDRFRDRITFGVRDTDGALVGFTARSAPSAVDSVPKYLNTPRSTLYDKGAVLFGLGEQADHLRKGALPVITEGPLDAIAVHLTNPSGRERVAGLAVCGTAPTERQGRQLSIATLTAVLLAFDSDTAGSHALERAYHALRDTFRTLQAATMASGADPAHSLTTAGPVGLCLQLAARQPLADRIVDDQLNAWPSRHDNAETTVACLRRIARSVCLMTPEDIARQAARLTQELGLAHETVTRELTDALSYGAIQACSTRQPASINSPRLHRVPPLSPHSQSPNTLRK